MLPGASSSSHSPAITEVTARDFMNHEEQLEVSIMAESLKPTPENKLRWEARKMVDQLIAEAAKIAKRERNLKLAKTDENEEASENDETATLASSVSKSLSNLGSSLGVWRPKAISVLGSVTEEASKTSASKGSQPRQTSNKKGESDLESADREVEEAETKWKEMIVNSDNPENGAEIKRAANGGLPPDSSLEPSLLLEFWKKADQKAIKTAQEQEKLEKEKRIAEELQERWQSNTTRWKARAEADLREREAQEAEEKAKDLLAEKLTISAKSGVKEKEKQVARDVAAMAKIAAEETRRIATQAQEEWLKLARNHHSITSAHYSEHEETGINETLNNLKQADQAVNDLWIEVTNSYDKDEREIDGNQFSQEERIKKEAEQYQITLLAKREADIRECFKEVKEAQRIAKKKYDSSTAPANRAEAKRLYEKVDQLEVNAWQSYTQIAKSDALTAARKKTPGATEAWVHRTTHSEEERKKEANAVVFKAPCKDSWADENQRSLARLTVIAGADEEAFKIYQKEETRLNDIATIWRAVIESKDRALRFRREKAVKSYQEGDLTEWKILPPEERTKYNNELRTLNNAREEEITNNLQEAKELAEKLRQKADKSWKLLSKTSAEKAAKKAEDELAELETQEEGRKEALRWPNLTSAERETELIKEAAEKLQTEARGKITQASELAKIAHKNFQEAKSKAQTTSGELTHLWSSIANILEKTSDYWTKANKARKAGKKILADGYREAAEIAQQAADQWKLVTDNPIIKGAEGDYWDTGRFDFHWVAEKLEKAIEAEVVGKPEIARKYRQAAEQKVRSVEPYVKAGRAKLERKKGERRSWSDVQKRLCDAAEKLEEAIKAEVAGKPEIAQKWCEAAEQHKRSAELSTQAARAYAEGKTYEGYNWYMAGRNFYCAADELEKTIKAEVAGESILAQKYREAAENNVYSGKFYIQAARAHDAGKTEEDNSWNNAIQDFNEAAKKLVKAIEAESAGKSEEAQKWREAAEQNKCSVEFCDQATKAYAEGRTDEGTSWNMAGLNLYNAAEKLEKAINAESAGKQEVALKWREAAEQHACSIEAYTQSARAYAAGKTSEGESWAHAGLVFYSAVNNLADAIETEARGEVDDAKTLREEAAKLQKEAEERKQAAEELQKQKPNTEADRITKNQANAKAKANAQAAKELEETIKDVSAVWDVPIEIGGQTGEEEVLADTSKTEGAHKEVNSIDSEQSLLRIEADKKLIETWRAMEKEMKEKKDRVNITGAKDESRSWDEARNSFYFAAGKLEKAMKAETDGKSEVAQKWREAAEQNKCSVEPYTKAARAYTAGKTDEGACWNDVGVSFYNSSVKLGKAIDTEARGKVAEAQTLREEAAKDQKEAEERKQAVEKLQQQQELNTEADRITKDQADAKAKADNQAAEELKEAIKDVSAIWDVPIEIGGQGDDTKVVAGTSKTEGVHKEVNNMDSEQFLLRIEAEQKEHSLQRAAFADTQEMAARAHGPSWEEWNAQAQAVFNQVKNHVWPFFSKTMHNFIQNPSETRLIATLDAAYIAVNAAFVTAKVALAANAAIQEFGKNGVAHVEALNAAAGTVDVSNATATLAAAVEVAGKAAEDLNTAKAVSDLKGDIYSNAAKIAADSVTSVNNAAAAVAAAMTAYDTTKANAVATAAHIEALETAYAVLMASLTDMNTAKATAEAAVAAATAAQNAYNESIAATYSARDASERAVAATHAALSTANKTVAVSKKSANDGAIAGEKTAVITQAIVHTARAARAVNALATAALAVTNIDVFNADKAASKINILNDDSSWQENINWTADAAREIANFVRIAAAFKAEQAIQGKNVK
ncbi:MAG TPA: hypothetical protein VJK54_02900 [Chthoniobacterales bacterium]|nr:hypothetical protein [Chthoniobacterales bacterium]